MGRSSKRRRTNLEKLFLVVCSLTEDGLVTLVSFLVRLVCLWSIGPLVMLLAYRKCLDAFQRLARQQTSRPILCRVEAE